MYRNKRYTALEGCSTLSFIVVHAKVHGPDHGFVCDEKVARVEVGVEETIFQHLLDDASHASGHLTTVHAGCIPSSDVVNLSLRDAPE